MGATRSGRQSSAPTHRSKRGAAIAVIIGACFRRDFGRRSRRGHAKKDVVGRPTQTRLGVIFRENREGYLRLRGDMLFARDAYTDAHLDLGPANMLEARRIAPSPMDRGRG